MRSSISFACCDTLNGGGALVEQLRLTPFAREEFVDANAETCEPVERARRLIIRAFMGFGSNAHSGSATAKRTGFRGMVRGIGSDDPRVSSRFQSGARAGAGSYRSTGFRSNSDRSGTTPAHDWANYPDCLIEIISRLRGVVIENRAAIEVIRQHDSPNTLIYADPPYLPETRSPANKYDQKHRMYRHELTVDDHRTLLEFLQTLDGMVLLSGYPHEMYDRALAGWRRLECAAHADGARPRTEVLWINPAAAAALDREHAGSTTPLFARSAE